MPPYIHSFLLENCKLLFSKLIRNMSSVISQVGDHQQRLVKRLMDYIEEHCMEDPNLSDITRRDFFMHTNRLSKLLKDMTGSSFSKYLPDVRMKNAVSLIKHRDLSIFTIAQLVGYNSESHFVQVFRRYYGQTPGGYRKELWWQAKAGLPKADPTDE